MIRVLIACAVLAAGLSLGTPALAQDDTAELSLGGSNNDALAALWQQLTQPIQCCWKSAPT